MSIVDDFAAIGGRLAEIERKPDAKPPVMVYSSDAKPVVWSFEYGYSTTDTAPSEYCAPAIDCG